MITLTQRGINNQSLDALSRNSVDLALLQPRTLIMVSKDYHLPTDVKRNQRFFSIDCERRNVDALPFSSES